MADRLRSSYGRPSKRFGLSDPPESWETVEVLAQLHAGAGVHIPQQTHGLAAFRVLYRDPGEQRDPVNVRAYGPQRPIVVAAQTQRVRRVVPQPAAAPLPLPPPLSARPTCPHCCGPIVWTNEGLTVTDAWGRRVALVACPHCHLWFHFYV
jgi:hypothetical protein